MPTAFKPLLSAAALAGVALFSASAAHAQVNAYTFTPSATSFDKAQAIGFSFTTNTNLTVTNVGYFDAGAGINAHTITFYNAGTNAVVGSGTVAASASTTQGFLYGATLGTPISLLAGTTYIIGTDAGTSVFGNPQSTPTLDDYYHNVTNFAAATVSGSPAFTFGNNRYGTTGTEPTSIYYPDDPGNFGPGFQIAAAPEPSSLAAFAVGLLSLGVLTIPARKRGREC